jgi:hypothetical protein
MGPGEQGVLYEHWELEEYGTPYDFAAIKAAIAKFDKKAPGATSGGRGSDDDEAERSMF